MTKSDMKLNQNTHEDSFQYFQKKMVKLSYRYFGKYIRSYRRMRHRVKEYVFQNFLGLNYAALNDEEFIREQSARLFSAIFTANYEEVRKLASGGANLQAKNKDGFSPLTLAVYMEKASLVDLLITLNADLNYYDGQGKLP